MMNKTKIIALYLPQFHPIPENDLWWGKGFTEWTNVAQAKPLFRGHYQPRIPSELGFYDLRLSEVREAQAQMAKDSGIYGFCYYHYWFGNGKQLLERPFNEVLSSGKPDFPFCLCWANHTWSNKTWKKSSALATEQILIEQKYGGIEDYTLHFNTLLPAFNDERYIRIDGKPVFVIYDTIGFKEVSLFIKLWQELAVKNGLDGIYFIGMTPSTISIKFNADGSTSRIIPNTQSSAELFNKTLSLGFDAVNSFGKSRGEMLSKGKLTDLLQKFILQKTYNIIPNTYNYSKVVANFFAPEDKWDNVFPTILPQWDRSPRVGKAEGIYVGSTPTEFKKHLQNAIDFVSAKPDNRRYIFLKSWNEWAEGNYVEPDIKYGDGYLKALKEVLI
ncbi:MAG: glycoside hydrolase family 99-like domain-containing protein [Paludibacteraceae bacterium]|nr:glycoside hydrolase family 99-like domain-containing protein [Paludibacteraceae bacterium]